MRHLHVLLMLAAIALASVPAAGQRPGFDRERIRNRESALNEVLQDIQVNHPKIGKRLESVLGDNPQRGRWRMARQARYLRVRADAERQDPVTFALFVQQETQTTPPQPT